MCSSIWLLTSVLVGGGPVAVPVSPAEAMTVPVMPQQGDYMPADAQPRHGLLYRIGNWFHRDQAESYSTAPSGGVIYLNKPALMQTAPEMQPMAVMPVMDGPVLTTVEPPTAESIEPVAAQRLNVEVKKDFQTKVGHADDYTWITGQLFYVHADGGVWVLRYASVSEEDRYGGSAVLAPAVNMKNYREGDLVSVSGEVLEAGRTSRHLGGCLFRASSIDLIERAD